MNVSIGSAGRFHTFDLAGQLEKRGLLESLYTAYPWWKLDSLVRDKVKSFPWVLGPAAVAARLGLHGLQELLNYWVVESFDQWVASGLEACDVYHCLSSFGLKSHRVAREHYGALTVCDRGSSHIVYQDEILTAEYDRWGHSYQSIDQRIVARELQEYEECDLIFVPSSFAYRSFVQKGVSEKKLVKVPYGVDLELFHSVPKTDNIFRVVYVGVLSLQKGLPYLLEAVYSLRLPRFEVWLIGSCLPEVRPCMGKYEGNYRYLGIIARRDLYRYYSQGSVFVIASVQDGFGLVQAQAMACGLPVIATENTGAEDLFTDGVEGFIVPIRNPEAIREKVLYLYERPDVRDEMSRAAIRRVRSLGGWDTYGSMVVAAYERTRMAHSHAYADPTT